LKEYERGRLMFDFPCVAQVSTCSKVSSCNLISNIPIPHLLTISNHL
jgi:hypothetical protein